MTTKPTPAEDAIFVRPSSHSTWMNCQLAVQHRDHPQYDNTSTQQASFGTCVHMLNERHIEGLTLDGVDHVLELWLAEMDGRDEDIRPLAPKTRLESLASEALMAHQLWVQNFWLPVGSQLEAVAVEQRMEMPLGSLPNGREVWLRGTADFVTPGKIWDWKTASVGWKPARMDEMTQHLFYAALVEYELDVRLPEEAAYVVYDRKDQSWAWSEFTTAVTRKQVKRALHEIFKMAAVLDAEAAMASPAKRGASWGQDGRGWWCSAKWCGAWDFCDGKFLLDDGKAVGSRDNTITWR